MLHGNKAAATKIVNKALEKSKTTNKLDKIFENNIPNKIVKRVIIAGATKQVPVNPTDEQKDKAVLKHLKAALRKGVDTGKNSVDTLAQILENGLNGTGALDQSKKALEALAKANSAYSTYRFSR
jgi:ribosomal protein S7